MRYRNKRTGAVIETTSRISGGDWVEMVAATPEKKAENVTKTETAKPQTAKASAKSTAVSRTKKK